jgi:hypothetical protein
VRGLDAALEDARLRVEDRRDRRAVAAVEVQRSSSMRRLSSACSSDFAATASALLSTERSRTALSTSTATRRSRSRRLAITASRSAAASAARSARAKPSKSCHSNCTPASTALGSFRTVL